MFKKRFHNLGSLNIGPRVLAIMLAITLATGAVGCGRQNNTDTPVANQETQTQETQTSEQPKEEQKKWFMSTGQYFIKRNEFRKAQNAGIAEQFNSQTVTNNNECWL